MVPPVTPCAAPVAPAAIAGPGILVTVIWAPLIGLPETLSVTTPSIEPLAVWNRRRAKVAITGTITGHLFESCRHLSCRLANSSQYEDGHSRVRIMRVVRSLLGFFDTTQFFNVINGRTGHINQLTEGKRIVDVIGIPVLHS